MWRRIKKWWDDKGLLLFAQGLVKVLKAGFRIEEAFAPPKRRARLREFREKTAQIERDKDEAFAAIDAREQTGTDAMYDAMETFTEKYGSPDGMATLRGGRERLQAMRSESEALKEVKAGHEGNPVEAVAAFRAYAEAHPESRLVFAYTASALREAKEFDAAITMHEERIRRSKQNPNDPSSPYQTYIDRMVIGSLLTEKGEPVRAVAHLERLLRDTRGKNELLHASTYSLLGEAYYAGGNKTAARKAWKESLKRDDTGILKEKLAERLREIE